YSSRRRHTRSKRDWSSDVCSSDLVQLFALNCVCGRCNESSHGERLILAVGEEVPLGHRALNARRPSVRRRTSGYNQRYIKGAHRSEERRVGKQWGRRRTSKKRKRE